MSETNILNGGVETLDQIKGSLSELASKKSRSAELLKKEEQLGKDLVATQKAKDSEIERTVAARKSEVEKSFETQIDKTKERIKTVKSKRDKEKGSQVSARISAETAGMTEEKKDLERELKNIFRRDQISLIYNNDYFFSMFMPNEVGDFCIIVFTIVIALALPAGIFVLLPDNLHTIWMALLLYAVILLLSMSLFVLIFKKIRVKHIQSLYLARDTRAKIKDINKQIKKHARAIKKDKDESGYSLESFDNEISELEAQISEILSQQQAALKTFEATTERDITNEISVRYIDDLERMTSEKSTAYEEQKAIDARIKELTLEISTKYEAYIGKDMLTIAMVEQLKDIINNGDASNIADAIAFYKRQIAESKKE